MAENTRKSPDYLPNCDLTIWLRSCREEVTQPVRGEVVQGEIPTWLKGSLVRNGPGGIQVYGEGGQVDSRHIFDGPGLLQKFSFRDGGAFYENRFIRTKSHERNLKARRLVLTEFGTLATPDPCHTIFHRISALFRYDMDELLTDTANISVHPFGDEVYTIAETGFAHRIDLKTLETTQNVSLSKDLGIISHTSHPHFCPETQKVYNIGQRIHPLFGPRYLIAEMDPKKNCDPADPNHSPWKNVRILASIPSRFCLNVCYMHSFAMTPNYFIMIEQPLTLFFPKIPITLLLNNQTIASHLQFYPEEPTIFHVLPRHRILHGVRRSQIFKTPAFFFLHTINAYEVEGDALIVDVCCYNDSKMIDCMYIDALKDAHSNHNYSNMFRGRPYRFRLDLNKITNDQKGIEDAIPADKELIVDFGCETPRINYDLFNGKDYSYFYAISSDTDLDHPGWLVKVNVKTKTFVKWGEPHLKSYGSEPIYVPRPGAKTEDDGIVLSTLLYGGESPQGPNKTSVVILEAKTWELLTKVDFQPGTSIPKCLHGWFFPQQQSPEEQISE